MTSDELHYLSVMPATTEGATHLSELAYSESCRRRRPRLPLIGRGRWDLLTWFAKGERIVSHLELDRLLAKYRREH